MAENRGKMVFHGEVTFSSDTKYGKTASGDLGKVIKSILNDYKTDPRVKDFLDIKMDLITADAIEWEPGLPTKWSEVFNTDLDRQWGHIDNAMEAAGDAGYKYFSWNGWVYAIVAGMTNCKQLPLMTVNLK